MATLKELLDIARAEIGVKEFPRDSNCVKYNTLYYGREVYDGLWDTTFPWCAVFVWWVFRAAGMSEQYYDGYRTASCPILAEWFKKNGRLVRYGYRPGDIVFFDFGVGGTGFDHVGIIEEVNSNGTYTVIEGNTSLTSDNNGGEVMRRVRLLMSISGAGRVDYDPEPDPEKEDEEVRYNKIADMPGYAQPTIMKLCDKNYLRGQGGPRDEEGRPADLDLSLDMIRVLVILDRKGTFDD